MFQQNLHTGKNGSNFATAKRKTTQRHSGTQKENIDRNATGQAATSELSSDDREWDKGTQKRVSRQNSETIYNI